MYGAVSGVIKNLFYIKSETDDESLKIKCQEMINYFFEHFPDAAPKPEPISQDRQ